MGEKMAAGKYFIHTIDQHIQKFLQNPITESEKQGHQKYVHGT